MFDSRLESKVAIKQSILKDHWIQNGKQQVFYVVFKWRNDHLTALLFLPSGMRRSSFQWRMNLLYLHWMWKTIILYHLLFQLVVSKLICGIFFEFTQVNPLKANSGSPLAQLVVAKFWSSLCLVHENQEKTIFVNLVLAQESFNDVLKYVSSFNHK
jgi:hypothetical protein